MGILRPGPAFRYGPDAFRAAIQFEPLTTGRWRPQAGIEVWSFLIGCDAAVGADCDPFGVSAHAAIAWYPIPGHLSTSPYIGGGVAVLRGPSKDFALTPDGRVSGQFLGRRPVAKA